MSKNLAVIGVSLSGVLTSSHGSAMVRREVGELFRLYTAGSIKPVIAKSFPCSTLLPRINTFTTAKTSARCCSP